MYPLTDLFSIVGLSETLSEWLCPVSLVRLAVSRGPWWGLARQIEWVLSVPFVSGGQIQCACGADAWFGREDAAEPFIKTGRCAAHKRKTDLQCMDILHGRSVQRFRIEYFACSAKMRWMDADAIARVDARMFERMRRILFSCKIIVMTNLC